MFGMRILTQENTSDYEPIVIMKKNGKKPLVVLDADYFVKMHSTDDENA